MGSSCVPVWKQLSSFHCHGASGAEQPQLGRAVPAVPPTASNQQWV